MVAAGPVALSTAVWGGMLFSDASAFAGVAAFGAVCVVQLAQRAWRRLRERGRRAARARPSSWLGRIRGIDARAAVPGLTAYWSNLSTFPVGKRPACRT